MFLVSDSIGFGTNVRLEEAYPKILESLAGTVSAPIRTEVISYSMPGLSLRQKFHLVERYARDYDPDLIVIDYAINDIEFESKKSIAVEGGRACAIELIHLPFPCSWKDQLKQSAFLFVLQQGIENVLHRMNWEDRNHFYAQVEGDYYHSLYAMSVKREYLDTWFRNIGNYQRETGIPVLIPIFPLIYDYAQYKWEDLNQLIIEQCQANGLAHVSLLDAYRAYPWNELRVQRGDFTHPSVKGNTVAAEAILASLWQNNFLTVMNNTRTQ
jgi:lysophospholipase L1-like esterase